MNWIELLAPWTCEPEPVPEATFTPWAEPGWQAWNGQAVEVQIADFLGRFVDWLQPNRVIETGVGQGFITRRYQANRTLFESDPEWRTRIVPYCPVEQRVTFWAEEAAQADLTILDSNAPLRFAELWLWIAVGAGWCFVHDTGNGHPKGSAYTALHATVKAAKLPGVWLDNPRGAWLGCKQGIISDEVRALWSAARP